MIARLSLSRRLFAGGLGLIAGLVLAGCATKVPEGIEPVSPFDVTRYSGTWYEIARLDHRFERGLTNVSATYELKEDGKLSVLNKGYDTEKCQWEEIEGTAKFLGARDVASLAVTFFWPFAGGYHVFALDEENYSYALVSGPNRNYFWILAREREIDDNLLEQLIATAADKGFATDDLIFVEHGEAGCAS